MERARRGTKASVFYTTPYGNVSAARAVTQAGRAKLKRARSQPKRKIVAVNAPLMKQVKGLLAAKTKDAQDVSRNSTNATTSTVLSCLYSTTQFNTSAAGTGILAADADEVLINSVRIRGLMENPATLLLNPNGAYPTIVRKILVWYYKPQTQPSAAGTLPPVTEVLVADSIQSMVDNNANNAGRFRVLSDRLWNLGMNFYQATTAVGSTTSNGNHRQIYDYTIKIGKKCHFEYPSNSGTGAGGTYDSDDSTGRVSKGLLVLYTLFVCAGASLVNDLCTTRVNYTG